jgi:hypothetical protein
LLQITRDGPTRADSEGGPGRGSTVRGRRMRCVRAGRVRRHMCLVVLRGPLRGQGAREVWGAPRAVKIHALKS